VDPARDLLEQFYIDFNDRNVDAVLAAMHTDIDWPNDWEGGRIHGREAMRDYWRRQFAEIDPHLTPLSFSPIPGGGWAVEVQQLIQNRAGEVIADDVVTHAYAFEDGLIRSMQVEK
jgi:hypothetical protein